MYKLFFIARNNMKKQKGDMITFFVLTLFAAFLIFDAVSAVLGTGKVLDEAFTETKGADMMLITGDSVEELECARQAAGENAHVTDFEATPALRTFLTHRNAKDSDWEEYEFLIEDISGDKKYMVHEPSVTPGKDEILLPLNLQGRFRTGDTLQVRFGDTVHDFRVAGYVEEPYFCSTMNITVYYCYMSREGMDMLTGDHPELEDRGALICKVVMDRDAGDGYTNGALEKDVTDRYKKLISTYADSNPGYDYLGYIAVSWDNMRGGSSFLPLIVCAMVMLFAVIILVVAVIIITFSIRNFIQRSMKDTGVLEAGGYTVKELRGALTVQVALAALLGSLAGVALGIATFGVFGSVVSGVLGLSWNQPVNPAAAALTVLGLTGLMILDARWVSRAFRKFTVLDALRGGINTHNYRKNHCSFEKSALPVPAVLSLKDTLGNPGRNVLLAVIAAILTIAMLIGFGMYENFGKDTDRMVEILGFEDGEISVTGGRELGEELRKLDGVENVLGSCKFEPTFSFGGTEKTASTYAVDNMENTLHTIVIDGRMEIHDNEMMLTSALAKDLGAEIGDVVTVTFGSRSAEYLVTGTNQRMEMMGRTGYMTFAGAERIAPNLSAVGWMVTGKDGVTYEDLKQEVDALAAEKGESWPTSDIRTTMENTIGTMSAAMKALCIGIAALTILIVIFVEALIIRAKIIREWRGMGISKALGMTSCGLIGQIMLSNLPAIAAGVLAGVLLAPAAGSRLTIGILSIFGIEKLPFHIPAGYMAVTAAAILAVALATAGLLGLRVRGINPVEMITEE